MNHCDKGHVTNEEVRRLPTTKDGGAIIVCRRHYRIEMSYRWQQVEAGVWESADFPTWESLEIYTGE